MDNRPIDLTKKGDVGSGIHVPMVTVYIISALLTIAGILIASVIPELTSSNIELEDDRYSDVLTTISVSTIDHLVSSETIYNHVSVPEAYFITINEESNISGVDSMLKQYLDFMMKDTNGYRMSIREGQGWEMEFDRIVTGGSIDGLPDQDVGMEILVDLNEEGEEITIRFILEIWEVGPT